MKIIADLHTHSIASGHSYGTIQEMGQVANKKGLDYLAITDHGPALPGAPTFIYFRTGHLIPHKFGKTNILFGCEANILDDKGKIDLDIQVQERLDLLLAGFHPYVGYKPTSKKKNTRAIINVIKKNKIDVISHIGNPIYEVDYEEIVKCLNDYNVLIEINNRSFLPDNLSARNGSEKNCVKTMDLCVKYNVPVIVSSDAHNQNQVGCFKLALNIIKREKFPKKLILNTSKKKVENFLNLKRPNRRPKEVLE